MNILNKTEDNYSATLMIPKSCNMEVKDMPICPICKIHPLFPVKIAIDRGVCESCDKDNNYRMTRMRVIIEHTVWMCELSCDMKKIVDEPVEKKIIKELS